MATGEQSIDTVAMNGGGIEQDGALRKRKGSTSKPRTEIKKRARSPKTKKENGLLDRLATYVIDNQISMYIFAEFYRGLVLLILLFRQGCLSRYS